MGDDVRAMSARDDAISSVQVAALTKWAPRMAGLTTWEAAAVVDAVEPILRADERHFLHSRGLRSVARVERDLADLRAKVEGLPERDIGDVIRKADVLALLDEGKP